MRVIMGGRCGVRALDLRRGIDRCQCGIGGSLLAAASGDEQPTGCQEETGEVGAKESESADNSLGMHCASLYLPPSAAQALQTQP